MEIDLNELERLAGAVKDWKLDCSWIDGSEDGPAAVVGAIDEEGNEYPVVTVDCNQYFKAQDSAKVADFYAAANPAVVLELVRRLRGAEARATELEADVKSSEEMQTLRFCEREWATEREALMRRLREAENDTERLNFLERRQLEIDSSGGWNEDPTFGVTRVSGGRNDRKWTCLARGETLREAIDAAMQRSKGRQS